MKTRMDIETVVIDSINYFKNVENKPITPDTLLPDLDVRHGVFTQVNHKIEEDLDLDLGYNRADEGRLFSVGSLIDFYDNVINEKK